MEEFINADMNSVHMDLKVIEQERDHVVIKTKDMATFEITKCGKGILIFGYYGLDDDSEEEPEVVYDTCGRL